jgi:hypothetical protein
MIARLFLLTLLGVGALFGADAKKNAIPPIVLPTKPAGPAPITFETFRLIGDRNIFNPNRVGRSSRNSEEAPPRSDIISFVGTMDYAKGYYAFFDGSERAYQQTLKEGGKIGPFIVKNITADSVELARDPNPFSLKMGQQLRKPVGGDWTLVGADVARAEARAAEAAAAAATATQPQAIPADASEALRRLMEKRQNQLKQ